MQRILKKFTNFAGRKMKGPMSETYLKPEIRVLDLDYDRLLCLSDVSGAGGYTSDYGEDDENIF